MDHKPGGSGERIFRASYQVHLVTGVELGRWRNQMLAQGVMDTRMALIPARWWVALSQVTKGVFVTAVITLVWIAITAGI